MLSFPVKSFWSCGSWNCHSAEDFLFPCTSVSEPHHFYAAPASAPALGKDFIAAPAPTLLYNKPTFLKQTKVNQIAGALNFV
jgi:hypothetical protein